MSDLDEQWAADMLEPLDREPDPPRQGKICPDCRGDGCDRCYFSGALVPWMIRARRNQEQERPSRAVEGTGARDRGATASPAGGDVISLADYAAQSKLGEDIERLAGDTSRDDDMWDQLDRELTVQRLRELRARRIAMGRDPDDERNAAADLACPGCGDMDGDCGCAAAAEEMGFFDEAGS